MNAHRFCDILVVSDWLQSCLSLANSILGNSLEEPTRMTKNEDVQPEGFSVDLRLSSRSLIIFLLAAGMVIGLLGGRPETIGVALPVALAMELLALVAWWLESRVPSLNVWLLLLGLGGVTFVLRLALPNPLSYAFLLLPVMSALSILGRRAAVGTAVAASLAIAIAAISRQLDAPSALALLVLLWFVLILQLAVDGRVRGVTGYAWNQYQEAVQLLDEARSQQARLFQTTRDLTSVTYQLSVMNERLETARRVAEEAQKAKAAFVANVSHEFRTPLNMIIGLTDLLVENPQVYGRRLPVTLLEDLEIVRRNSEHLSTMINDVLDLSQVEAGRLALHKERVSLARIIERAAIVVQPLLDKKNLSFEVVLPADLPEVYCDLNRIRQVIVNLLSNAARFTESGGITVRVEVQNHDVLVCVKDTGPGISQDDAQKLFLPFSQGENGQISQGQSSGLGLSISKQFVELHGGRMWLESCVGEGASFFFRLPISPPIEPEASALSRLVENWPLYERTAPAALSLTPARPRIVVCDPGGDFYPLMARYAEDNDYVQVEAVEEVVREVERIPAQAVVLNMPSPVVLFEAVELVKRRLPEVPVYGVSFPLRAEQALAAGAYGYLSKPVTRAQMIEAMNRIGQVERVLLVDDHVDELALLRRMLMSADSRLVVDTAATGHETLERIRADHYDLVFLDIMLPDMNGWQVLSEKGLDETIRDVPVMILSGRDPSDHPLTTPVLVVGSAQGFSVGQAIAGLRALSSAISAG
jgi:signal transduction histidine kinase/CheY-like chemotaxis protein